MFTFPRRRIVDPDNNVLLVANLFNFGVDKAVPLCEQTLEKQIVKLNPDNPTTLNLVSTIGDVYRAALLPADAIRVLEPLVKRCQTKRGRDHPTTLYAMNNLALAYQAAGKIDRAIALFERTLAARTARVGVDHPSTLTTRYDLASAYQARGDSAGAESMLRCRTLMRNCPPSRPTQSALSNWSIVTAWTAR